MNISLGYIFIPLIIYVGVATSISDFRYHKIKNKTIVTALYIFALVFSLLILWNFFPEFFSRIYYENLSWVSIGNHEVFTLVASGYFLSVFINSLITLVLVFILWELNVFAAGDAKLFFLYSLLVPLSFYWKSYLPLFPSACLFINTFVSLLFYLLIKSFIYVFRKNKKNIGGNLFSYFLKQKKYLLKNKQKVLIYVLRLFIGYLSVFYAMIMLSVPLSKFLNISGREMISLLFLLLILFRKGFPKIFTNKKFYFFIFSYFFILFLFNYSGTSVITFQRTISALKMMIVFFLIKSVLAVFIYKYLRERSYSEVALDALKTGDIIDIELVKQIADDHKFVEENNIVFYPGGVDENNVEPIKKWLQANSFLNIKLYRPFPLAFWIFIGVVFTLAYQGSILKIIFFPLINAIKLIVF